ncbi:MAG: hypothetical protein P8P81_07365 [Bacteroidia bacterium]|jgi:hypothetical protein|nr:hypothetical protein [Bacteroidia bacterium]
MNVVMYIIGFILFGAYCCFMAWSISYGNKKQEETNNYANLSDPTDMDGMGNFSRFPKDMANKNKG